MKICFLAPADNYHTIKWCNYFLKKNYEVHVITFTPAYIEGVNVHCIYDKVKPQDNDIKKLGYLLQFNKVRNFIEKIEPNFISVHYASSYGVVAALSGIKNYSLSVWGSDVYDFPKKSIFHRLLLKFSLFRATQILSTSKAMAVETNKYTDKVIDITPFGVDMELFNPNKRTRTDDGKIVLGLVKTLEPKYGIKTLLEAVAIVRKDLPHLNIELRIAGKGSHANEYKEYADYLGMSDMTKWLGFISQDKAACEYANMDCAIIPSESESESFGVSAVEAQACGCPVIISDVPGLMEATKPNVSSLVSVRGNKTDLADKITRLINDDCLRKSMGTNGREYVYHNYEVEKCFTKIEKIISNCIFV